MALTAYLPLETVYKFHETAEQWILRRYPASVEVVAGAERRRVGPVESIVDIFPDRNAPQRTDTQTDAGQQAPERCTVYLRTRLLRTDTTTGQPADVLFDPLGGAWQAVDDGRWDEARGYGVELVRSGRRGRPPW